MWRIMLSTMCRNFPTREQQQLTRNIFNRNFVTTILKRLYKFIINIVAIVYLIKEIIKQLLMQDLKMLS